MPKAKAGDSVKVHYTGTFDSGSVFDSSKDRDPLPFKLGEGHVIKGFEDAVLEMETGEKKIVRIDVDNAYGAVRTDLIFPIERTQIPADVDIQIGMPLEMMGPDDQKIIVMIDEINDTEVTLNANHPLAGKDLNFELELVAID
jgi:peptidylprolyl isomerase